jgi:hypothetical protein
MKGWTDLQNWFRYTWSVKFLGVLNLTLTDIRLAIQGQAAGFNQAGHMLGDAVIQGMVAALNAGAASVAGAIPLGAGAGAGGGGATPYVPPSTPGRGVGVGRGPVAQSAGGRSFGTQVVIQAGAFVFNGSPQENADAVDAVLRRYGVAR